MSAEGERGACARCAVDPTLSYGTAKFRAVSQFEHDYLTAILRLTKGNVSQAARKAEMDRMHLHRMLARHGIDPSAFHEVDDAVAEG